MGREDLERLSKPELIELVLKLQRPAKTSRTSSKPPSTDRKEKREQSRPGGAKPGHEGHKRVLSADPDAVVDHRPTGCPGCGLTLSAELPAEVVSVHEEIDIPPVKPRVEQRMSPILVVVGRDMVIGILFVGVGVCAGIESMWYWQRVYMPLCPCPCSCVVCV